MDTEQGVSPITLWRRKNPEKYRIHKIKQHMEDRAGRKNGEKMKTKICDVCKRKMDEVFCVCVKGTHLHLHLECIGKVVNEGDEHGQTNKT